MAETTSFDVVLVGGGLQSSLIALAIEKRHPGARLAIVERGAAIGGEHTWCFHADDVPAASRSLVDGLVEFRWDGYDVRFPAYDRTLRSPYAGFTSDRLRARIEGRFAIVRGTTAVPDAPRIAFLECEASEIGARSVSLRDGRVLDASLVVDARGPAPAEVTRDAGYQKFVGRELRLARPHGLVRPIVMDARVEQRDGFRFFYVLPLTSERVLVEDTVFSSTARLDRESMRTAIENEVARRRWHVAERLREEEGVLPMAWHGTADPATDPPLRAGYRGGWAHPATGYSFPAAVRLAEVVAAGYPNDVFGSAFRDLVRRHRVQARYAERLNGLLFRWFAPERRISVFERFYRLPEDVIRRFYSLRMSWSDRVRILVGRPPRGFSLRERRRHARRAAATAGASS